MANVTKHRRLSELTDEEARAEAEALCAARDEADREDAPLLAQQLAGLGAEDDEEIAASAENRTIVVVFGDDFDDVGSRGGPWDGDIVFHNDD